MTVDPNIQQYVRIALYLLWGALANYGVVVSTDKRAIIASVVGAVATLAWTAYGTRLNGLLEQAKAKSGVDAIEVKVDPAVISARDITVNTSPGITASITVPDTKK